ncbi:phosphate/phosphite/phosphonate ABC transporter substrate-binding protein [Brevibacterium sp. 'Marine']|uniref:phosphate/phosphite/phosphonate ABC transporter substrate-binding protein n=1 Tax=Brevibacterium sp. 'Marine' TaxID=2725563 RepID=UPI00145E32C9|nr:phosphate/phosphite/phosphonate ABC transporter substrate-binding protein [Brevibacterium sp. 'Marine']
MTSLLRSKAVRTITAGLLALPLLAACGSSGGSGDDTITFAAVPAESSSTLESSFENVTKLLEEETGQKVEFQNASDYAAVIEGMRAGQIDAASFGPFAYVIAKDSGIDIEPAAAPTNDKAKDPAYTSLAYVKKGSDITGLKDLKGKKVCFVDKASTSGYLVPMKGLQDEGIDMDKDLEPVLSGGHDASLLSLNSGDCDAAFAHDAMLTTLEKSGQVEKGSLEPVWESDPITEDPIAVNNDSLDADTAAKITNILREKANVPAMVEAGTCDSEDDCVLPEEITYGYKEVSDADFDAIRDICDATQADACKNVG